MPKKWFCIAYLAIIMVFASTLSFVAGLIVYEINSPLTGTASAG